MVGPCVVVDRVAYHPLTIPAYQAVVLVYCCLPTLHYFSLSLCSLCHKGFIQLLPIALSWLGWTCQEINYHQDSSPGHKSTQASSECDVMRRIILWYMRWLSKSVFLSYTALSFKHCYIPVIRCLAKGYLVSEQQARRIKFMKWNKMSSDWICWFCFLYQKTNCCLTLPLFL